MVREIVIYGDAVLREKCVAVNEVTEEHRELSRDMLETMAAANGIGLAAPQIGVPIQLAVIDVSHDEECVNYLRIDGQERELSDIMPLVFVNPRLKLGAETGVLEEGCLSFPEIRGEITRPSEVVAELGTLEGESLLIETDGLLGRAIQHETDHLFGVLFIDRMSPARKLSLKKDIRAMRRDYGESFLPAGR
ncbi:MAG: peptide deformylase [Verrucomicrobiales bacterium]